MFIVIRRNVYVVYRYTEPDNSFKVVHKLPVIEVISQNSVCTLPENL